jgi:hypothetical protein
MRLKQRSRFRRGLSMAAGTVPAIVDLVRGLWRSEGHNKWLAPLLVFLCLTGVLIIVASSVEALAPFIYSIF